MASVFLRSHPRWSLHSVPLGASNRLVIVGQLRFSSKSSLADEATVKQPKPSSKQSSTPKAKNKPATKTRPQKLVPPKRAMNVMQLVTQDVMAELKQQNGKLTKEDAKQCFTIAAEKYRSLSDADKKNYLAELDRRREIYEIEMRDFLDSLTPNDYINQNEYIRRRKAQGRSTGRKGIPKLDPNAPKRPLNGFMIFCGELRANPSKFPDLSEQIRSSEKDSNSSAVEGSRILANYWKSMPDEVKQEYVIEGQRRSDLYKQEKAQYDAQLKSTSQ
ncbi:exp1-like protein [Puccinia graminis f. sp. tritici]|uniref:Exp1-like protein n=1 Tax=Puccinia graminis f. sp. tritici TaxID=56615 RepID=A0A5B0LJS2_PUCGR|nr:exp1-like protein [Puccinia graminis f. sp. tritici]KAA1092785.1 exp1-like protein [Puccinia graminis f. sp. tritici]